MGDLWPVQEHLLNCDGHHIGMRAVERPAVRGRSGADNQLDNRIYEATKEQIPTYFASRPLRAHASHARCRFASELLPTGLA